MDVNHLSLPNLLDGLDDLRFGRQRGINPIHGLLVDRGSNGTQKTHPVAHSSYQTSRCNVFLELFQLESEPQSCTILNDTQQRCGVLLVVAEVVVVSTLCIKKARQESPFVLVAVQSTVDQLVDDFQLGN